MKALITPFALGIALAFCGTRISYAQQETDTSSSIILPPGFTAEPFYVGIPNPDGIAVRSDGTLFFKIAWFSSIKVQHAIKQEVVALSSGKSLF